MSDIELANRDGTASMVSSVGAKDSQNNIRLVVDLGDKAAMEIPLIGKLVVDLQQNSGAASTVNSVGAKDSQSNVKLVLDMSDKAMEIPLTGKLVVDLQQNNGAASTMNSVGTKDSQSNVKLVLDMSDKAMEIPLTGKLVVDLQQSRRDDEDQQFLREMRGWMVTVATLFVSMAFQEAMQPPGWMPRGDWVRILPKYYVMWTGASSVSSHADRPAMPASPPSPPPLPAITVDQAWRAESYVFLNAATFGMALTLVLILLLMPKKHAGITMLAVKIFMGFLALTVTVTFALGTSDEPGILKFVLRVVFIYAAAPISLVALIISWRSWRRNHSRSISNLMVINLDNS